MFSYKLMGHFLTFLYNVMLATSSITFAPADVELNVIGEPIVITEQNKSDFALIQPNILYEYTTNSMGRRFDV